MKDETEDLIKIGLGLGIVYLLYQTLGKGIQKVGAAVGSGAGFVIADFYTWAVLEGQNMNLQGNIVLPDGTLTPLQSADIRNAPNGTVAALVNGQVYQLLASDANGNWPAVPWS